jgi:hypothetical protein
MNKGVKRENIEQIEHSYHPGDHVLLTKLGIVPKMSRTQTGPFAVTQAFTNGSAQI